VLQGMIDGLVVIGRCCGLEISVEKCKEMRISMRPSSVHIIMDQKRPENVEFFQYLGSMLTHDTRCTLQIYQGL